VRVSGQPEVDWRDALRVTEANRQSVSLVTLFPILSFPPGYDMFSLVCLSPFISNTVLHTLGRVFIPRFIADYFSASRADFGPDFQRLKTFFERLHPKSQLFTNVHDLAPFCLSDLLGCSEFLDVCHKFTIYPTVLTFDSHCRLASDLGRHASVGPFVFQVVEPMSAALQSHGRRFAHTWGLYKTRTHFCLGLFPTAFPVFVLNGCTTRQPPSGHLVAFCYYDSAWLSRDLQIGRHSASVPDVPASPVLQLDDRPVVAIEFIVAGMQIKGPPPSDLVGDFLLDPALFVFWQTGGDKNAARTVLLMMLFRDRMELEKAANAANLLWHVGLTENTIAKWQRQYTALTHFARFVAFAIEAMGCKRYEEAARYATNALRTAVFDDDNWIGIAVITFMRCVSHCQLTESVEKHPLLPLVCFLDKDVQAAIERIGQKSEKTGEIVKYVTGAPGAVFERVFVVEPIAPDSMTLTMLAQRFNEAIVDIRDELQKWNQKKIQLHRSKMFDDYQRRREPIHFVRDQYFP
jgi:hypothetical protein